MTPGTPCRHCGSPARCNPCWKPVRGGMCKGAHDRWLEELAREAADLPIPPARTLEQVIAGLKRRAA